MGVQIETAPGKGAKRALDFELNLVPFIDLLSCLISFLLITAVWTQMARINVSQKTEGQPNAEDVVPPEKKLKVTVVISEDGYTLVTSAGEREQIPRKDGDFDEAKLKQLVQHNMPVDQARRQARRYDTDKLATLLREIKKQPQMLDRKDIQIASSDLVDYWDIIKTMDVCLEEKFEDIALTRARAEQL